MKTSIFLSCAIAAALSIGGGTSRAEQPSATTDNVPAAGSESIRRDQGNNAAAPRLSRGVKDVLKMQENGIDKNVIRSYIESSSGSSQPTSEEIIYLHQRGFPDDLTAALIQHSAQVRAQAPTPIPNQDIGGNNSAPVTPTAPIVQAQPNAVAPVPVYSYPQYYPEYVDSYSYPVYGPSFSFGYWGGPFWPYYRAGFYGHPFVNHGFNHFGHGFVGGGHFNGDGHFGGGGGHFGGGHVGGGGHAGGGGHR